MTIDMQARRDAFLMLTGEIPPNRPKRWLVVWGDEGADFGWNNWASAVEAQADAADAIDDGFSSVGLHDLDAQS